MTAMTQDVSTIDVRTIEPRERHPLIFSTFDALAVGQSLLLINDHDPKPLHYQFKAESPGLFSWDYLQSGPEVWQVRIGRIAGGAAPDAGCSCGGRH